MALCKKTRIDVKGKIIKNGPGDYDILIFCSRKSIDKTYDKLIGSHNG